MLVVLCYTSDEVGKTMAASVLKVIQVVMSHSLRIKVAVCSGRLNVVTQGDRTRLGARYC